MLPKLRAMAAPAAEVPKDIGGSTASIWDEFAEIRDAIPPEEFVAHVPSVPVSELRDALDAWLIKPENDRLVSALWDLIAKHGGK